MKTILKNTFSAVLPLAGLLMLAPVASADRWHGEESHREHKQMKRQHRALDRQMGHPRGEHRQMKQQHRALDRGRGNGWGGYGYDRYGYGGQPYGDPYIPYGYRNRGYSGYPSDSYRQGGHRDDDHYGSQGVLR